MNLIQEEQWEYDKFMLELAHKVQEIQQEFSKLSDENKRRVYSELGKFIAAESAADIVQYFNQRR